MFTRPTREVWTPAAHEGVPATSGLPTGFRSAVDVHLGHDPSQQLARSIARQLVDEHHISGDLVARQVVLDVQLDLLNVLRCAGLRNNEGTQPLSELRVLDTDHGRIEDIVTLDKQV